ncbi:MAG: DegT/DnrJ/EryC1/StrS family aminotransferase [Acidobacteriota bacterium]
MQVPFVDLKAQYQSIQTEIDTAVLTVLSNCNFILGQEVDRFETDFAKYLQIGNVIGVSSGLDALRLTLEVFGIGVGDEVILPANTFIATALAVSAVGARPVLVDIDPDSYNIDPNRIEAAITAQTRAIMPVHLYGQPCDLDPILEIARDHNLRVIEDACQSHGACYRGRRSGTIGDIGCFSFYPGKNLGAYGDGGAVVTADAELAEKIRRLRNYGQRQKYYHSEKGLNARLDTLQAAVLGIKLKYLDQWNRCRVEHAKYYCQRLREVEQICTPELAPERDHIFHLFVVRVRERAQLQQFLAEQNITTIIHYPIPIHLQAAYQELGYQSGDFPVTERAADEILSLPIYAELQTEQIDYVTEKIAEFYRKQ